MDTTTDTGEMLKDAGHAVDGLGVVWLRYLDAPVAEVWDAISTSEGLQKWWLGGSPRYTIELRVGGIFQPGLLMSRRVPRGARRRHAGHYALAQQELTRLHA
jgi:hypothetical protein